MAINYLKKYFNNPPGNESDYSTRFWQERIVSCALIVAAILGVTVYLINIFPTIQHQRWVALAIYSVALICVLCLAILQKLPYRFRAGSLTGILYFLGVITTLESGIPGDGRIWLMGFSTLAAILFGRKLGVITAFLSMSTLVIIGILISYQIIPLPDFITLSKTGSISAWITSSLVFCGIALTLILSLSTIFDGLERGIVQRRSSYYLVEQERDQLKEQSQDLERRQIQLRTAAEISRAISAEIDPDIIFQQVVDLIKERFNLYYVGVFVLDETGNNAVLRAGTGDAGKKMLAQEHKLSVGGTSMIGWATSHHKARIALDTGEEAIHFNNPYLPHTRSELALPMISGDKILGAFSVQSKEAEAFDQDDIIVLQGITDSLASALEIASLFQQLTISMDEISSLHQQYLDKEWSEISERYEKLSYTYEGELTGSIDSDPPTSREEMKETLNVPINLRDQLIGSISLETDKTSWSPEEKALIESVTTQTALALENVRLLQATQRNAVYNRSITEITGKVWESADIDSIMRTAIREIGHKLNASDGFIRLEITE